MIFVQPEDFSAGTIREARPFRVPQVTDEKSAESKPVSENAMFFKPTPGVKANESYPKPASALLPSEIEAESKRKHAEALKKELEAMEKRIVQRKEDALRDARQKRAIMFQEEAALAEAEKKRATADKEAEVKRLIAEKSETFKNEEAAQRAEEASLQADAEEEVAASRAQKAEEQAYEAQRRSEKAQQEVEEFRRKAKKDLEEARRQAQEYADKARWEREQAEAKTQWEAETKLEASKSEKEKAEAMIKPKEELALEEQGNPSVASEQNIIEQKELGKSSDSVEETLSLAIEKTDDSDSPLFPLEIAESTAPFTSPVSASTVRLAASDLGFAALPFAAIVGGTVAFRNHRIKNQLERHVTLRELSKERIEELAEEESNRMQVSVVIIVMRIQTNSNVMSRSSFGRVSLLLSVWQLCNSDVEGELFA